MSFNLQTCHTVRDVWMKQMLEIEESEHLESCLAYRILHPMKASAQPAE